MQKTHLMMCAILGIVFGLALAPAPLRGETFQATIGSGESWTFVNGTWTDDAGGELAVSKSARLQDGQGMQSHHYAFQKTRSYTNLNAKFEIRLTPHSDAGLIFHAANPGSFYVLHFPNCGQASRVQNFWAALSHVDSDGYWRIVKLEFVHRVPGNTRRWLPVEVAIENGRLRARVGGEGLFEASEVVARMNGRVGAYLYGDAGFRNLAIEGNAVDAGKWDESLQPPQNWIKPIPPGRPRGLAKAAAAGPRPNGDLLLSYSIKERGANGRVIPFILRSRDNGRTWLKPQPRGEPNTGFWEDQEILHRFPDGKLRLFKPGAERYTIREFREDGSGQPETVQIGSNPPDIERVYIGPQAFLNLADGSVLLFAYGPRNKPDASVFQWGARHSLGFAARSTDNGRTFSDWVNVDNPGIDPATGKPAGGALDFTEISAAQTGSGRILAFVRPIYSPWMWQASSMDNGKTWEAASTGPFPGYATPNMLRTRAGAILVAHRLPGLTINLSVDDGRTFDQGTMIDSAIWAMGSMLEVEPDVVLYVYYDSFMKEMRMQRFRITKKGIEPMRAA